VQELEQEEVARHQLHSDLPSTVHAPHPPFEQAVQFKHHIRTSQIHQQKEKEKRKEREKKKGKQTIVFKGERRVGNGCSIEIESKRSSANRSRWRDATEGTGIEVRVVG
jgi:hypothetical protein